MMDGPYLICLQRGERLTARNLDFLWFYQRKAVAELQDALIDIVIERSAPGFTRAPLPAGFESTHASPYAIYVWSTAKISGVVMTGLNYPERAVRQIFNQLESGEIHNQTELEALLQKAATPIELDKVALIERDLAETKLILLDNLEKVLARGEKLEDLVARSDQLSASSKLFLSRTRRLNRCPCSIM